LRQLKTDGWSRDNRAGLNIQGLEGVKKLPIRRENILQVWKISQNERMLLWDFLFLGARL